MEYDPDNAIMVMATDFTASLVALANALVTKGVLSRHDIAAAAQERLLVLQAGLPPEYASRLGTLKDLATKFESRPPDEWPRE